jgi:hypothetical protein
MAIDFRKELNARLDLLTKSIEDIEKKSKSFPEGWINIRCRNGRFYYYFADADDKDRYLAPKDDEEYKEDMVERANGYSEAGIILGDRLFYTFESEKTPLDMRTFDRIIDTHFR